MITFLASSNIPDTQTMQLSGHKNIHNLNSYNQSSLQPQQDRSHILSSYNQKVKPEKSAFSTRPTWFSPRISNSFMPLQLFQGATITDRTIHINCNTSNLAAQVQGTITKKYDKIFCCIRNYQYTNVFTFIIARSKSLHSYEAI